MLNYTTWADVCKSRFNQRDEEARRRGGEEAGRRGSEGARRRGGGEAGKRGSEEAGKRGGLRMVVNYWELDVYKLAREGRQRIFKLSRYFPKEEMYSLTDQIRRSS